MRRRVDAPFLILAAACLLAGSCGSGPSTKDPGTDAATDPGVTDLADAGGETVEPSLTPGAPDRFLLTGRILAPDEVFDGQVLVEGRLLACVRPGDECASLPGAAGATVIETRGVIAPGLIDTHNHILFDVFDGDDWLPERLYQDHDEWPEEPRYKAMMAAKRCLEDASQGRPDWCPDVWDGSRNHFRCEMDKWGELKGLVAGTTSIVGLPGISSACFGSLSRSIDVSQNDLDRDCVQTSALFPPADPDKVCANFVDGTCGDLPGKTQAWLVHCGEGVGEHPRAEFEKLRTVTTEDGCLFSPRTVITHGTAFTADDFQVMATHGMKLAWSPASNVALYGATTDIPAARAAGVLVSLAPDWSMGGSQNLLDELRFADRWDDDHWGDVLSRRDLVDMVTGNAAKALALDDRIGALREGMLADLLVVPATGGTAWDAILAATPGTVRLVMVDGRVLFGDASLKAAGPVAPGCETLDVCGSAKFLCVAEENADSTLKLGQTHAEIRDRLQSAMEEIDRLTPDGWDFSPLSPLVRCP